MNALTRPVSVRSRAGFITLRPLAALFVCLIVFANFALGADDPYYRWAAAKFGHTVRYAGRGESASPAVGSLGLHKLEQKALIKEAFSTRHGIPLRSLKQQVAIVAHQPKGAHAPSRPPTRLPRSSPECAGEPRLLS